MPWDYALKGMFAILYYVIFPCILIKEAFLEKITLTRNNQEIMPAKSVRVIYIKYMIYIYNICNIYTSNRLDRLRAL